MLVYFSVAYNMVKNTVQWLSATQGVEVVEVAVEWPIAAGDEELLHRAATHHLRPGRSESLFST